MKLGEVLKEYRYAKRMDIRTMAKEVGVSIATISRIENGKCADIISFQKLMNWLVNGKGGEHGRPKRSGSGISKQFKPGQGVPG